MRIIVTGGAGFIGSHLVDRLLADGADVGVVDDFDRFYPRAAREANLAGALRSPRCRLAGRDIHYGFGARALVDEFRPDLAIAKFARLIDRGEPVPMLGDGTTRRDYTFVAAMVDDNVPTIDRCRGHHLDNLRNADPVELRRLIEATGAAPGKEPVIPRLPEQPGDVRQTCADIARAAAELGYAPRTPLAEGLGRYVEWYRSAAS